MKPTIAVIGAGIKGTAVAAILSLQNKFKVVLLDREAIGSGATSANHGRLHLGSASWRTDQDELITRRLLASTLMRQLRNVTACLQNGLYCIEGQTDLHAFLIRCAKCQVPYRIIEREVLDSFTTAWIDRDRYSFFVELPEYSFNPARLAGRFASLACRNGVTLLTSQVVKRVNREGASFVLELSAQSQSITADYVINCAGRWSSDIEVEGVPPIAAIDWHSWRLLCIRANAMPALARVIVIVDEAHNAPSVLPQTGWITVDGRPDQTFLPSKTERENYSWDRIDMTDPIQNKLYTDASSFFNPLRRVKLRTDLFSFAGIQGRWRGAPPGSRNRMYSSEQAPNYAIAFGGQATTGLLDAIEVVEWITGQSADDRFSVVEQIARELPDEPHQNSSTMIWDKMGPLSEHI